jgi:putative ABC transport system permease protein
MTLSFWWQDVRQAVRLLARRPLFALCAVLVLALGIGPATALFTLMNAVLFRPWQVPDPDRMAVIRARPAGEDGIGVITIAEYRYLREHSRSFSRMAAWRPGPSRMEGGPGEQIAMRSAFVSAEYFEALGVRMTGGRGFVQDEEDYAAPNAVAVISYRLWQDRFGGDPGLVGRTIRIGRQAFTVVGVAAPGFEDVHDWRGSDVWMPLPALALTRGPRFNLARFANPRGEELRLLAGRLRPGVTRASAAAELSALSRRFRTDASLQSNGIDVFDTRPLRDWPPDLLVSAISVQAVLALAVTIVLLVACANAGNLLLARALSRQREFAIRLSLGAGRVCVIRQVLLEAGMLSAVAGALGLGFALAAPGLMMDLGFRFAAQGFWPIRPQDAVRSSLYAPDASVFLVAMLLVGLTAAAAGLAPVVRIIRGDLATGSRPPQRGHSASARWRFVLLAAQVALTAVLLVGAGLLTRAIARAGSLEPGFMIRDVYVVSIALDIPPATMETRGRAFFLGLRDALGGSDLGPVAFTGLPPFSEANSVMMARRLDVASSVIHRILTRDVSRDYFGVLGIAIVKGRLPEDEFASREVVVNESAARMLWPDAEPVGKMLENVISRTELLEYRVVGVVEDVPVRSMSEIEPVVYQMPYWPVASTLLVRSAAPGVSQRVRAVAAALEPHVTVTERPLVEHVRESLTRAVLASRTAWAIGALGLVLAMAGALGVFAQVVEERRREIGIRMALGARPRQIAGVVFRTAGQALLWGLAAGFVLSALSVPVLRRFLYGLNPFDPVAYAGVALTLSLAAAIATWIPARRAIAVDAVATLRSE